MIVVLTGFASIATAVEAIKLGAWHYLVKPSSSDDIEDAFGKASGDSGVALTERPTSIKTVEWEHIHQTLVESEFQHLGSGTAARDAPADARAEA